MKSGEWEKKDFPAGAREAGRRGERQVAEILGTLPEEYTVFNDLLLRTPHGTSEIDHLIVSPYGVMTVETKNYAGKVTGSDKDVLWTQIKDGRKKTFRNPVRQGFTHVQALLQVLQPLVGGLSVLSIVAFPASCELDVRSRGHIVTYEGLKDEILAHRTAVLSEEKQTKIRQYLEQNNRRTPENMKKHIASIRRKEAAQR